MKHFTTIYQLSNDENKFTFNSEKEACKYLGVAKCTIASCYRRGSKCKGYSVERVGISTHHSTKTRLYKIWDGMNERCYRQKHPHYKDYGGRGIAVCEEWRGDDGFYNFKKWAIKSGYTDDLTIDRIDNNGMYKPQNCRWVTVKEQMNNKRHNHFVSIGEESLTVAQCSEKYSIPKSTIVWREKHCRNILTGAKMDGKENSNDTHN